MARRTIKIKIPTGYPEQYTRLIEKLWKKHQDMGASSPLHNNSMIDMAKFETTMQEALSKREQALDYHAQAEALMQESRWLMGVDIGQTINDPGTLYNMLDIIKKILLIKHRGEEESLSPWGYNVVIGEAKMPVRKSKGQAAPDKR